MNQRIVSFVVTSLLTVSFGASWMRADEVKKLKTWLEANAGLNSQLSNEEFANVSLSKEGADQATALLWSAHTKRIQSERKREWKDKVIGIDGLKMKFEYQVYGAKPKNGRSLFISMHGGGGAPTRVNDQQWRNQINLYRPEEGVYLAPRAPTDAWNLWHQGHIDKFFTRIIENAIVFEEVNPNRVYIMGYSAGGDGVYQLAPRMADQLAAAAMMAGHPNDAKPLGLRNIGFTLHMGGRDSAYQRNKIAREWKSRLATLRKSDPQGYEHSVVIHEQHAHWMNRDDAVAVPWMAQFTRNPFPKKIVWFQSGTTHARYYWLAVDDANRKKGSHIVAERNGQSITINQADKVKKLRIRLNDHVCDLDEPIVVKMGGKTLFSGKVNRTIAMINETLSDRGDRSNVYVAEIEITIPVTDE